MGDKLKWIAGAVAVAALAAACGSTAGKEDAPVGERHEQSRQVWVASDGFPNIEAFCIGSTGVYVSTRPHYEVIPDDANCDEGGVLSE
jgi:hypothetical protein